MLPFTKRYGSPDWLQMPFGGGYLLDIGCGVGGFLREAGSLGWKCYGIDTSRIAVAKAKEAAPSAVVRCASLNDLGKDEMFDFVNMSHVLEHVPNPLHTVQSCSDHLRPQGMLRLQIPNIGSMEAKFFSRRWRGLDMPRHVHHFSTESITALLSRTGFVVTGTRPAMAASSISESIVLTLPKVVRYRLLNSMLARSLYLAMVLPASLSYLFGNDGAIEVTAVKQDAHVGKE